jgi:hypothetical protein
MAEVEFEMLLPADTVSYRLSLVDASGCHSLNLSRLFSFLTLLHQANTLRREKHAAALILNPLYHGPSGAATTSCNDARPHDKIGGYGQVSLQSLLSRRRDS